MAVFGPRPVAAQDTLRIVKSFQTIDPVAAYFKSATIPDSTRIGWGLTGMGDIDRDGVPDLALSLGRDTLGTASTGAVLVLFMNSDGTVKSHKHISSYTDAFNIQVPVGGSFAGRLANIGDLNGDGMTDLAVMDGYDDDGGTDHGAVYILFLDTAATVIDYQKISDTQGGFTGTMTGNNGFRGQVAEVGDMNGDGIQDLAVGASLSDDGGAATSERGALWILLMNRDGTVNGHRKYSATSTWPGGNPLTKNSNFGFGVAKLGDLDGDGYNDIAVSARSQGDNGRGRLYILFLNASGGIKAFKTIGPGNAGNLGGLKLVITEQGGQFGWSLSPLGDLNGDGTMDLAIGLNMKSNGYFQAGAVLIGYLKPDGTLQYEELISQTTGTGPTPLGLHASTWFGEGVGTLGDLDGDHVTDLVVSAPDYSTIANRRGRLFILKLHAKPLVLTVTGTDGTVGVPGVGSAVVKVVGGVRPYQYLWGRGFPDEAAFEAWRDTTEALPDSVFNALGYADLLSASTPRLDSLGSGAYDLRVIDGADSTRSARFVISSPITDEVATGVSVSGSGKDYTKTASDGWTNTEVLTTNTMNTDEDGWVEFILPQSGKVLAVGLRQFGLAQVNGYEQMSHAFYFDGTQVRLWYGGSLHSTGLTYGAGDRFRLERIGQGVTYYKNEAPIDTVIEGTPKAYAIDLTLYTNGAQVKGISTGMHPAGSSIQLLAHAEITQMSCDNAAAQVHATYSGTQGIVFSGLTYTWSPGPSPPNSADFTTSIPGRYTLTITGVHSGTTYSGSVSFWLGYKTDWTELADCVADAPPYTHTLKHVATPSLEASGASVNEVGDWTGHWALTRLNGLNPGLGWSESLLFQDLSNGSDFGGVMLWRVSGLYYRVFGMRSVNGVSSFTPLGPPVRIGTRLQTLVSGNHLVVKRLNANSTIGETWTWSNALAGMGASHRLEGRVLRPNSRLLEVLTSLPCGEPQRALLSEELQEGYHRADRKRLQFGYVEEYGDTGGSLGCVVHGMDGTVLISSSLSVQYGYNELELPLVSGGDELAEGFYWLEVTDAKGFKQYLRFHYQPLLP